MIIRTITLALLMVCTILTASAETEPNDNYTQANTISFNGSTTGTMDSMDTYQDWFKISTSFDAAITITGIFDDTLSARVELYDANLNLLDSSLTGTDTLLAKFQCGRADIFYVKITHRSGKGTYVLKTNFKIPLVLLAENEPNNSSLQYLDFTSGNPSGSIGAHMGYEDKNKVIDTKDWFRFSSTKNGQLHVYATIDSSLYGSVKLYDNNLNLLNSSSSNITGDVEFIRSCVAPNTFYIEVTRSSGCGSYVLKYDVDTPAVAPDAEPNDVKADAVWLPGDTTLSGHVGLKDQSNNVDQLDWYVFKPKQDGKVVINAVFDSTIIGNMFLLNKVNGQVISPATGTGNVSMTFPCAASDTFYIRVFGFNGCGGYTLSYTLDTSLAKNDIEDNNTRANSIVVNGLQAFEGHLGYINSNAQTDTTDWYKLPMAVRSNKFNLTTILDSNLEASIIVYDSLLNILTSTALEKDTVVRELTCLQAEAHYVRIRLGSGCGGYVAKLTINPVKVPNDQEPNNSALTAQTVTADTFTGHSGYLENGVNNKFDYFSVNMSQGDGHCYSFTAHNGGTYQLAVLDSGLNTIPPGFIGQGDTFKVSNFTPPYTGKYIIRLERGSNTCTDYTIAKIKTINNIGLAKPTATKCIDDFVNLSAVFTGQLPDSVSWILEDAKKTSDFGLNITPQFTSGGWKDVTIKAYNCAGVFIKTDSVYITPEPTSSFTYVKSGPNNIVFTNTSIDYDSVAWFFDDGNTSDLENPTHSYNITAKYNVCLQTFNECGTNVYCDSISAIGVGINTITLPNYVKVFPNPTHAVINVDIAESNEQLSTIEIYSITGKLVKTIEANSNTIKIDVATLPKGVYIINIATNKAEYRTKVTVE